MRTFVFICTFALVCAARGDKEKKGATHANPAQHAAKHSEHPASSSANVQHATKHSEHPASNSANVQHAQAHQHVASPGAPPVGVPPGGHTGQPGQAGAHPQRQGGAPQTSITVQPAAPVLTKEQQNEVNAQNWGFRNAEQYRKWKETGRIETSAGVATASAAAGPGAGSQTGVHQFPSRHFDMPNTPPTGIQNVKFQPGSHIPKCQEWRDSRYNVFRKYTATWHDAGWWRSHHTRIVFTLGGWYYWHANYWFPAWGYEPSSVYAYDGPIYAFNNLEPDQVVANVQAMLQQLGYYHGPLNGVLDTFTREAIANYQADHGLYTTSVIDEPTLTALGMA